MTKQDFELIARVIDSLPLQEGFHKPLIYFGDIMAFFADALEAENPHFDREKFQRACIASEDSEYGKYR